MTRSDYEKLATLLGHAFARAGENNRELIYDTVYTPLVKMLAAENPRFNMVRFSYETACAEGSAPRFPDEFHPGR